MNESVSLLEGLGLLFVLIGVLTIIVAGIGLFRFPDLYLRASAVGTSAGLGVASIVLGVLILDFSWPNMVKAAIAIIAQLLTSAVGSMAIARSGYLHDSRPAAITHTDDLLATRRDQFTAEPSTGSVRAAKVETSTDADSMGRKD